MDASAGPRKTYSRGTHRTVSPAETLKRFGVHANALGLTRLADVTGLDYLGIPVFMAVRPNARSLSVAQGKGLDAASARVSAFMEAAELDHAERTAQEAVVASYAALRKRVTVVDPHLLPRLKRTTFDPARKIAWLEGREIVSGAPVFVPQELVDADFSLGRRAASGAFLKSTNGLASGNHFLEALASGLCETIERDTTFLFDLMTDAEREGRRLVLGSVDDPDARSLIDQLEACGISVAIWDTTSDIGVASFTCRIREVPDNDRSHFGAAFGHGCHLARGIALCRAITEAVQSRLTVIVGTRDDLRPHDYAPPSLEEALLDLARDVREEALARRRFGDIPTSENEDFASDIADLLARLHAAGLDKVVVFDLMRPEIGIPVVRVVVPGLEVGTSYGHCAPGPRARAFAKARR